MLFEKLALFLTLAACSVLVACGPDCTSMCEKAQEDGNCFRTIDGDDRNCEDYCEDIEELASEDNGDCEEELDELISCMDDQDDACDALEDSCADELNDFSECIADYCADNPNNGRCVDVVLD